MRRANSARLGIALSLLGAAALIGALVATAQDRPRQSAAHKVAIHVDDNDAKVMNLALNNAKNVLDHYRRKGETVRIEIVTYGPGLHMLRADTSPVKRASPRCRWPRRKSHSPPAGNTQANMSKQEGKEIALVSEARVVPSGVVQLIELQEQGYAYIRPSGR